jgi:hypothetical protein
MPFSRPARARIPEDDVRPVKQSRLQTLEEGQEKSSTQDDDEEDEEEEEVAGLLVTAHLDAWVGGWMGAWVQAALASCCTVGSGATSVAKHRICMDIPLPSQLHHHLCADTAIPCCMLGLETTPTCCSACTCRM